VWALLYATSCSPQWPSRLRLKLQLTGTRLAALVCREITVCRSREGRKTPREMSVRDERAGVSEFLGQHGAQSAALAC
jgi:hypothetical protein